MNATVQHLSPDHLRGRIMSVYTLMFIGMSPFGSLETGYFSDLWNVQNTLRINAIVIFTVALIIYISQKNIRPI
jgi:S-ribosylhomocysteine lyase LuxS involved in autoinducer biosynthesis